MLALSKTGQMYVWGNNTYGQTNAPANMTNIVAISAGVDHNLALRADGSVVAWGLNNDGEATVPPTLTNVVSISAGSLYSLALAKNFAPFANNARVSTIADADFVITLPGTDGNNDVLNYRIAAMPSNGALYQYTNGMRGSAITTIGTPVTDTNGQVIFAPGTDEYGKPYTSFQYIANDGDLDSAPGTVTIDVRSAPYANTQAAVSITSSNLVLQGAVTPNGLPSATWFEWGTNSSFGNRTASINSAPGIGFYWATNQFSITPGFVYHYRVVCSNSAGIAFGQERVSGYEGHPWSLYTPLLGGLTNLTAIAAGPANFLGMREDGTVVPWGFASLAVPAGISNVATVAENDSAYMTVHTDHTVSLWGNGFTCLNCYSGVGAIGAGYNHEFFIQTNGNLIGSGANSAGQATVPPNLGNIVAATGSQYCSVVLRDDGTVTAWGGYDEITNVPPGLSNVVDLACGDYQCIALLRDGTLRVWGTALQGNLNLPAAATNIVAIASGADNCYALRNDGKLIAWGGNYTNVPAGLSNIVAMATGQNAAVIIGADGAPVANSATVSGAANNDIVITLNATDPNKDTLAYRITSLPTSGALYQYTSSGRGAPILSNDTPVVSSAHYVIFAPAPNTYGTPYDNFQFTANDGIYDAPVATVTINLRGLPDVATEPPIFFSQNVGTMQGAVVPNGFTTTIWWEWGTDKSYGNKTTSSLVGNGAGMLWVRANTGTLVDRAIYHYRFAASNANGTIYGYDQICSPARKVVPWDGGLAITNSPASVSNVFAIAAGGGHDVAVRADGKVIAWGNNTSGVTNVPASATNVVAIAANYFHNVAARGDGTVVAWGLNTSGQTNVPGSATNVVAVAATSTQSFALRRNGTVAMWGNGSVSFNITSYSNIVALAGGQDNLLMLFADGTVLGAGDNSVGQTNIPAGLNNVVAIAPGLALKADGKVVGWGNSGFLTNLPPDLTNIVAIASGAGHGLALLPNGTVRAWGATNLSGVKLGAGPVPAHLTNVVAITANSYHSLAIGSIGDLPLISPNIAVQTTSSNVTLTGSVNPQFLTTRAWFDWGLTTNYDQTTVIANIGNSGNYITVSGTLSALSPGNIYHYRLRATNSEGIAVSNDGIFMSGPLPPISSPTINASGDGITFSFNGQLGTSYTVVTATNIDGPWFPLGTMIPTPSGFRSGDTFDTNAPTRFYRVQWP